VTQRVMSVTQRVMGAGSDAGATHGEGQPDLLVRRSAAHDALRAQQDMPGSTGNTSSNRN
jgi:hypothetical protein